MVPRVSVIIPTYNRAGLVREAVASVLAQTYRDFEIVVVDDASSDGTGAALAEWREVQVIRHPHRRGVSAARNTGIRAARGEWLALLDSDDLWLPEKLARQMAYLLARPGLWLCQTDETWVRRGARVNKPVSHRKVEGRIFLPSLARCVVSPSAVILHRKLIEAHGGFDETLPAAEDYDLWLRLTWRYEVGLVEEPLVSSPGNGAWTAGAFRPWSSCSRSPTCPNPMRRRPGAPWRPNAPSTPRAATNGAKMMKPRLTGGWGGRRQIFRPPAALPGLAPPRRDCTTIFPKTRNPA
ncbi:MAG: glycosyltransferase family A protein [Desulfobaccales bacterium]